LFRCDRDEDDHEAIRHRHKKSSTSVEPISASRSLYDNYVVGDSNFGMIRFSSVKHVRALVSGQCTPRECSLYRPAADPRKPFARPVEARATRALASVEANHRRGRGLVGSGPTAELFGEPR
jgi:hypothetical protein